VSLEVIRNGFIFVRSFAEGRDAVKLSSCQVVPGNHERNGRTIWKLEFLVPISSSKDRFYLRTHHVSSKRLKGPEV
jgi:hypothetical protein